MKPVFFRYIYIAGALLTTLLVYQVVQIFRTDLGGVFSVVKPTQEGSAFIYVYGISEDVITTFQIPSETMMEMALQRGEWRMGSIWKVIQSEGLDGGVLSNSIVKSLNVPLDGWSEVEPSKIATFTAASSLTMAQKIKLFFFARGVQKKNQEFINFADTSYLYESRLADGEYGFSRQNEMSGKLRHYFISPEIVSISEKVQVVNSTGKSRYSINSFLETLETLGSHVVSIKEEEAKIALDCIVESQKTSVTVKKIKDVFKCDYVSRRVDNFDIRISVGEKFLKRF